MEGFVYVCKDIFSQLCFCWRPVDQWFVDRMPPNGTGDFTAINQIGDSSTPSDLFDDIVEGNEPKQDDTQA